MMKSKWSWASGVCLAVLIFVAQGGAARAQEARAAAKLLHTLTEQGAPLWLSPDGRTLAFKGEDVQLYDVATGTLKAKVPVSFRVHAEGRLLHARRQGARRPHGSRAGRGRERRQGAPRIRRRLHADQLLQEDLHGARRDFVRRVVGRLFDHVRRAERQGDLAGASRARPERQGRQPGLEVHPRAQGGRRGGGLRLRDGQAEVHAVAQARARTRRSACCSTRSASSAPTASSSSPRTPAARRACGTPRRASWSQTSRRTRTSSTARGSAPTASSS